MPRVALVIVLALAVAAPAAACPPDAAEQAAEIEATLDRQKRKARRWDNGWALTFAVLAAGQAALGLAEWVPGREFDEATEASIWIGASKATIGSLSHLILRLKIPRGGREAEPCARLASAEAALRVARTHQKRTFFLNHAGSLALNVGGLLILGWRFDAWKEGAMSMALGYPIGLLSAYTQPRGAWHARVVRTADYTGIAIGGAF